MHKTTPQLDDQQVSDLAAGVRTRIDWLNEVLADSPPPLVETRYRDELGRQHALYQLLIGVPYER